jgi:hypothetical protein
MQRFVPWVPPHARFIATLRGGNDAPVPGLR